MENEKNAVPVIRAEKAIRIFGEKTVLFDIDFQIFPGESIGIIGGSGSGKTTLLRLLSGLDDPDSGKIAFCGRDLRDKKTKRDLSKVCGIVFQNPYESLNPRHTLKMSVTEPLRARASAELRTDRKELREQIESRANKAFRRAGLDPDKYANRFPCDVSGGQAQRAAIARALAIEPKILIADEPMSAVDVSSRLLISETLQKLLGKNDDSKQRKEAAAVAAEEKAQRPALIIVSHDMGTTVRIADKIIVICDGRIVETGKTEDIISSPKHEYTKMLIQAAMLQNCYN